MIKVHSVESPAFVPFHTLVLNDKINVRKTAPKHIEEVSASLGAHKQLQSLLVRARADDRTKWSTASAVISA
jgi:hypothetical protein